MKHITKIIHLLLLPLMTIFSYGQHGSNDYFGKRQFNVISKDLNGVEICIDPRIEFFQILNMVGGNPAINITEMSYKQSILSYFEEFKDHPAFDYLRNNYRKFFSSIDAPFGLLFLLNNDFTFREGLADNQWQKHPEIDTLLKAMREFLAESDFITFFNDQKVYYELVLQNTVFTLNDFDERKLILNYYGIENNDKHKFYLVLNSLGFGNFGQGIDTQSATEHYAVISPNSGNGSIPAFEKYPVLTLIWHEFGHSFSNPLVNEYWNDFNSLFYLYEPVKQSMAGQFYRNWKSVVYEQMARAVTCRLGAIKYSEDFAEVNLSRIEIGNQFIYSIPIIAALKVYEQSRDNYPTLESFMPNIINALKTVNQDSINNWLNRTQQIREPDIADIPSIGEIYNRDNRLLILSTNEEDTAADKRLKEFVLRSHKNFTPIDDTTALRKDLGNYNLLVIGTPWGNKFLEKYITLLPIKMTRERLIAQNNYEGKGYAFITGWINPFNFSNVMVIYTAQNPDDLINFTWIPRGNTDYQIVRDLITLKAADYKRYHNIWGCY
jgi:hypothetical protein